MLFPASHLKAQKDSLWQVFQSENKPEKIVETGVNILFEMDSYKDTLLPTVHQNMFSQLPKVKFTDASFKDLLDYINRCI